MKEPRPLSPQGFDPESIGLNKSFESREVAGIYQQNLITLREEDNLKIH